MRSYHCVSDVNPGASVVAGGDSMVYDACRGLAQTVWVAVYCYSPSNYA
jgi:hypothetical protein